MNVLKRCCMRSLKENRKRTLVTIVGVILATALITGVACLAESTRESLIAHARQEGDYHYLFTGVDGEDLGFFRENVNVEKAVPVREVGYAWLEGSENPDKPYLYIRAIDRAGAEAMPLRLTEGRMPETDSELVIGRHILYNGMVDLQVGDELTLQVGERRSGGELLDQGKPYTYENESLQPSFTKTYTVVGIVERPEYFVENRYAPGYSAFTYLSGNDARMSGGGTFEVYATYNEQGLKNADQVTAGLLGISEEEYLQYESTGSMGEGESTASGVKEQSELIRWQMLRFSSRTLRMLYGMAALAVAVIMVTSVFCIRNSFVISMTEKMRLYGMLASVGTTSAQQRKMVYYEAVYLGMFGIPIGILSGLGASVILVKGISGLLDDAMGLPMVFGVSVPAIFVAAALAAVTVFLSARQSAKKASKVTPLSAIRANDSIRIGKREMKCPRLIGKVFGVGGKVAYRNLRRARRRYRTTVISIVVSVAVFIGLSTFVKLLWTASGMNYQNMSYQMSVDLMGEDSYAVALKIAALEGVSKAEISRGILVMTDFDKLDLTDDYLEHFHQTRGQMGDGYIHIYSLGEEAFRAYCKSVGVDAEDAQDKAIVYAGYSLHEYSEDTGHSVYQGSVAKLRPGQILHLKKTQEDENGSRTVETEIPVLVQTDRKFMALEKVTTNTLVLAVSDRMMDELYDIFEEGGVADAEVFLQCEDAGKVEQEVRRMQTKEYPLHVRNYQADYREERSAYLLTAILLYGFITVVALIGITNIFNTITTNLELRAPEFAMLRAVGMTKREFRRMIWLEGLFYVGKALAFGIPLGLGLSVWFYVIFSAGIATDYRPPLQACALSAAAVALLLYGIMHYSMRKINRRNIVETIRNENL